MHLQLKRIGELLNKRFSHAFKSAVAKNAVVSIYADGRLQKGAIRKLYNAVGVDVQAGIPIAETSSVGDGQHALIGEYKAIELFGSAQLLDVDAEVNEVKEHWVIEEVMLSCFDVEANTTTGVKNPIVSGDEVSFLVDVALVFPCALVGEGIGNSRGNVPSFVAEMVSDLVQRPVLATGLSPSAEGEKQKSKRDEVPHTTNVT